MIEIKKFDLEINGKKILRDINCKIGSKITAIVGPSGVGKSSLLLCFNRLIDLKGNVRFQGEIIFENNNVLNKKTNFLNLRKKIGIVFQKPTPFPVSILQNLKIILEENRTEQNYLAEIEHVLRKVHLWDEVKNKLNMNAQSLSGGQQQKLCLARTLLTNPQIILLDEPCSSLDPISTLQIEELIKELSADIQIIIVTHNLKQAKRISDHILVFGKNENTGVLVETGDCMQVFSNPQNSFTKNYLEYESL